MYIGFFGAHYGQNESQAFIVNKDKTESYELWSGFAGVTLSADIPPRNLIMYPSNGTKMGGETKKKSFGQKPGTKLYRLF